MQFGITTPGIDDSFLTQGVTRSLTWHAHEITACALYILMDKVYKNYLESISEREEPKTFTVELRKHAELFGP